MSDTEENMETFSEKNSCYLRIHYYPLEFT
jgi:hypothetical protein